METVYIKKQPRKANPAEVEYVVPAVSIKAKEGLRFIPHPYGTEQVSFSTLEDAVAHVHRSGFAAEFEKQHYPLPPRKSGSLARPVKRITGQAHWQVVETAVPLLIEQLKDTAPGVIASAAFALGECRYEGAIAPLIDTFAHEDVTVRKQVTEAIAKMGKSAFTGLQSCFRNKHWLIRHSALMTLQELIHRAPEDAMQLLGEAQPLLKDENWLVRSQAATVFGEAVKRLRELEEKQR